MTTLNDIKDAFPEFTILRALSSGGQKEVFVACAPEGDTEFALKVIKPSTSDAPRTEREIAAVAKLNSSYVPQVRSHGDRMVGGELRYFIIEQFIQGETLRSRLCTGRNTLELALALGTALLNACRDFEAARLVHRDIKPENILIGLDEKIWVIDFGIVRDLDKESLTNTSLKFGPWSPGYGAPEQLRNKKSQIDVRTDLFSVGVVLYETLCGANPYLQGKQTVIDVIRQMESEDLPPLEGQDAELVEFVSSLSSRFPSRRPTSAEEALTWFIPICQRLIVTR